MIKEYWNLIGRETFLSLTWELDFSQAYSFRKILINHKNFDFTQIPDKTNEVKKPCFWAIFDHFCPTGNTLNTNENSNEHSNLCESWNVFRWDHKIYKFWNK